MPTPSSARQTDTGGRLRPAFTISSRQLVNVRNLRYPVRRAPLSASGRGDSCRQPLLCEEWDRPRGTVLVPKGNPLVEGSAILSSRRRPVKEQYRPGSEVLGVGSRRLPPRRPLFKGSGIITPSQHSVKLVPVIPEAARPPRSPSVRGLGNSSGASTIRQGQSALRFHPPGCPRHHVVTWRRDRMQPCFPDSSSRAAGRLLPRTWRPRWDRPSSLGHLPTAQDLCASKTILVTTRPGAR